MWFLVNIWGIYNPSIYKAARVQTQMQIRKPPAPAVLPSSDVVNNKFSSSKSNLRSMFAPISNVDPLLPLPTVFQTVEIFKQKDICKCGILILIFPRNISHENCRHTKTNVNSEIWPDRFNPIERGKIN